MPTQSLLCKTKHEAKGVAFLAAAESREERRRGERKAEEEGKRKGHKRKGKREQDRKGKEERREEMIGEEKKGEEEGKEQRGQERRGERKRERTGDRRGERKERRDERREERRGEEGLDLLHGELVRAHGDAVDELHGAPEAVELHALVHVHHAVAGQRAAPDGVVQEAAHARQDDLEHGQAAAQTLLGQQVPLAGNGYLLQTQVNTSHNNGDLQTVFTFELSPRSP